MTHTTDPNDPRLKQIKPNGQQEAYIVLTEDERANGFIRPLRRSYRHVGPEGPRHPLRDLTAEEHERYDRFGYDKYEAYPENDTSVVGRFWTQTQLYAVGKGCRTETTMSVPLAETYARDPTFYGATFCVGCGKHLPVGEFVWADTTERVGS
jgi:hypothetical protein